MNAMNEDKLVEMDEFEKMWSEWRGSGAIWSQFGISDARSAEIAKLFAKHAISLAREQQWIAVSERLPEMDCRCWCWSKKYGIQKVHLRRRPVDDSIT